jgi:hypothetical protein
LRNRGVAETSHGRVAGLLFSHPGGNVLCNLLLQMKLRFIFELLSGALAPKQSLQP